MTKEPGKHFDPGEVAFADQGFGKRLALILIFGVASALLLTWLMYALIQFSDARLQDATKVHFLDFVRLKRDESSVRKERKLERPAVDKAPPAPSTPDIDNMDAGLDAIAISAMPTEAMNLDTGAIGIGSGEGEFLPIVKVAPIYPFSASAKGIEGECVVEYTVTKNGSTRDIEVVEELCPNSVFRRPSVAAAAKFKYKPRVINGEAVEVPHVHNRFTFILEKPSSQAQK